MESDAYYECGSVLCLWVERLVHEQCSGFTMWFSLAVVEEGRWAAVLTLA